MRRSRTPVAYNLGRQEQPSGGNNGSCKPQSCQKQKDNYSTGCRPAEEGQAYKTKANKVTI